MNSPDTDPPRAARSRGLPWPLLREAALVGLLLLAVLATLPSVGISSLSLVSLALAAVAFLTGRLARAERVVPVGFAVVIVGRLAVGLLGAAEPWNGLADVVVTVLFGVLPWLVGRYLRQRAELARAGWQRADLLERERTAFAEQERLRERARIAEDMHDSLGHALSLIAIRAGALEVAPGPAGEDVRRAAGELRADATAAVERLQEIIGVLHADTDDAGEAAVPHGGVAGLVEHAREAGMRLTLRDDAAPRPARVELLVHRVVREALTNAAKHAPVAEVTVRVEGDDGRTTVSVANGPPGERNDPDPGVALPGGGRGLAALGERVRETGGTLRWTPGEDGGFTVTAELPHGPAPGAAQPPPVTESARRLAASRRRARRGLATAVLVPGALTLALASGWYGYLAFVSLNSVLPPEQYARLSPGQPREEIPLPAHQMPDPPSEGDADLPEGVSCAYYRPHAGAPGTVTSAYRLCFAEGRLVSKDSVPVGAGKGAP